MTNREDYARKLQSRFEEYMEDFAIKTNRTVEQIIVKYVGMDNTKEAMYNTDIILGFLADYYDYYTHVYQEAIQNDNLTDELKERIYKLDEEYIIFEKLISKTSEIYAKEQKEGKLYTLKTEEIKKGRIATISEILSKNEMLELSKWIRNSYYEYINKYRNKKITMILPGKKSISFEIKDDNLPHLLGITRERNISAFEKMKMITKVSEETSDTEVNSIFERIKQNFSYDKVKYRNFLFQTFKLFNSSNPLRVYYEVIPSMDQLNDCNTYIVTNCRDKIYNKSCLGLYCTTESNKQSIGIVKTLIARKKEEKFIGRETEASMITSIFISRQNDPNQKELIGIFSREEQYELIYNLLEESPEEAKLIYISLLPYFKRLEANTKKLQTSISKIKTIKEELSKSKSNGRI